MPRGRLLTDIDRQVIAQGVKKKKSHSAIAKQIGRSQSVVSRELARNTTPRGYSVIVAKKFTDQRARKTNRRKLDKDPVLREFVVSYIREGLSPEEVVGRLRKHPPESCKGKTISHEAVYDWIFNGDGQARRIKTISSPQAV